MSGKRVYVTTFYSFKGGVGRTLALLNVAYELAQSKHNVLVVDFDLEAPAIHENRWKSSPRHDESPGFATSSDHPGIVEYVSRYLETLQAPTAADYIVDATPDGCVGQIALMPSGQVDDSYGARLNAIDWNRLYREFDGYLLFEDLIEQWEALQFDYVLVDSRTGFTDVGGICTRHLPDAVVTLFRPDDQSLRGMEGIVRAIGAETTTPRRRQPIVLHFVMAAIPDADDEDGILEVRRAVFRDRLRIPNGRLLEILHYQSMDLLEQPIYTRYRSRTSLARSYQELTRRIRAVNISDRIGVLHYLGEGSTTSAEPGPQEYLERIRQKYAEDAEVLGGLAETTYYRGSIRDAADLLERMAELGAVTGRFHLRLAETRRIMGDVTGALEALKAFFGEPPDEALVRDKRRHRLVLRGISMLEALNADRVPFVQDSPVIRSLPLPQRGVVADALDFSVLERRLAVTMLREVVKNPDASPGEDDHWQGHLAFALMAIGEFSEARSFFENELVDLTGRSAVSVAFNLAMATWGVTDVPDVNAFVRVLDLFEAEKDKSWILNNANNLQAFAVAACFADRIADGNGWLDEAEEAIRRRRREISCWSYTRVPPIDFVAHCTEIRELLSGNDVKPAFMYARDIEGH